MTRRVSVTEGYRVMYSYPRTYPFASLKAEGSDPSKYAEDKQVVMRSLGAGQRGRQHRAGRLFRSRILRPDGHEKGARGEHARHHPDLLGQGPGHRDHLVPESSAARSQVPDLRGIRFAAR